MEVQRGVCHPAAILRTEGDGIRRKGTEADGNWKSPNLLLTLGKQCVVAHLAFMGLPRFKSLFPLHLTPGFDQGFLIWSPPSPVCLPTFQANRAAERPPVSRPV